MQLAFVWLKVSQFGKSDRCVCVCVCACARCFDNNFVEEQLLKKI